MISTCMVILSDKVQSEVSKGNPVEEDTESSMRTENYRRKRALEE